MTAPNPLSDSDLNAFIEASIPDFHAARLASLSELKLLKLIRSKNPYLYRAKNILLASDLVNGFLAAHLSSQEETLFGTFLERLAVFVSERAWNGRKSAVEGIDIELVKSGVLHIITIKSGPSWGNASQVAKMRDYFRKAARVLATNSRQASLVCINGCCYGRSGREDQGDYLKLCGQSFWEFLSGDAELYRRFIIPIGHRAQEHNNVFGIAFAKVANQFTRQLLDDFCHPDGSLDWEKLVLFNSGNPSRE